MPVRFRCAYCNQLMGISHRKIGTIVRCPKCAGQVVVPEPEPDADVDAGSGTDIGPSKSLEDPELELLLAGAAKDIAAPPQSGGAKPKRKPSRKPLDIDVEPFDAPPPPLPPPEPSMQTPAPPPSVSISDSAIQPSGTAATAVPVPRWMLGVAAVLAVVFLSVAFIAGYMLGKLS